MEPILKKNCLRYLIFLLEYGIKNAQQGLGPHIIRVMRDLIKLYLPRDIKNNKFIPKVYSYIVLILTKIVAESNLFIEIMLADVTSV